MDHARYAELFRTESRELLAELDVALLAYEQQADPAHVATLFRTMHSLKGMAAAMEHRAVEQLAHALESLLEAVRRGDAPTHETLLTLLFDGTDTLRTAVDEAIAGRAVDVESLRPLLQRLDVGAPSPLARASVDATVDATMDVSRPSARPMANAPVAREGLAGLTHGAQFDDAATSAARPVAAPDVRTVEVRLTADCPLKGVRAMLVRTRLEALGTVQRVQPPEATWHGDGFDGVFTVTLATGADASAIEAAARAAGDVARVVVSTATPVRRESSTETLRTVRVDRRRLDTLLDLVGELVITRDRLLRIAEETDQSSTRALTRAAHETARLISALQDEVLQARMVPVGQVFDRFPRLVRDIARDLGKDVQFVTDGREIELDRSLIDAIGDPLMHLLRNALDHGIEDAELRRARGKAPTGTLILRAVRDRAAVVLQVEDDGRGIDREAIRRRAVQQGLVPPGTTALDDDALLQVLAHPGFSTAHAVTAISGRGVGVDVVVTRVRALGGALELESIEGEGTVFTLRLPVTLAITRALLVQVGDETYALPAAHVVEALEYHPDTVVTSTSRDGQPERPRESIQVRDETVRLVHLREQFGLARRLDEAFVVVIEVAGRRTAVLVDALVSQQDIVVKTFDRVRDSAPWFSGATVLGDGTPALIVDLGSLQ
jgi:two-component system, chemotaxis family, sensor kinase CheA